MYMYACMRALINECISSSEYASVCVCVCVFAIAYIATKDFTGKLFATGGAWMIIG